MRRTTFNHVIPRILQWHTKLTIPQAALACLEPKAAQTRTRPAAQAHTFTKAEGIPRRSICRTAKTPNKSGTFAVRNRYVPGSENHYLVSYFLKCSTMVILNPEGDSIVAVLALSVTKILSPLVFVNPLTIRIL